MLFYGGETEKALSLLRFTLEKHPNWDFFWFTLSDNESDSIFPALSRSSGKCAGNDVLSYSLYAPFFVNQIRL